MAKALNTRWHGSNMWCEAGVRNAQGEEASTGRRLPLLAEPLLVLVSSIPHLLIHQPWYHGT